MKTQPFAYALWTLVVLLVFSSFAASFYDFGYSPFIDDPSIAYPYNDNFYDPSIAYSYNEAFNDPPIAYSYNRIAEIEKQCSSFISSASELNPDDNRGNRLKNELSFNNGDWEQETGGAPLMPFTDIETARDSSNSFLSSPLKLVSFQVTDVNPNHLLKNTASLSGVMSIGITTKSLFGHDGRSKFYTRPGISVLTIDFEGVYIETEENGGERLLCLLGNSTLPYWKPVLDDPSDFANSFSSNFNCGPRLLQEDQIFLVLRYPQVFNLTTRAIRGEMRSLNERESVKYFDQVYVSSQLGRYSKYQFSSERLKSTTWDLSPYQNELMEDGANMFNGSEFCKHLQHISMETFTIAPNWNFNGGIKYHGKLGPFFIGKELKTIDWSYDNFSLVMHIHNCEVTSKDNAITAKVSAVFRAIPATIDGQLAKSRTGLSGTTLSAEGLWNASTGQLSMIGCIGVVDSGLEGCDSQISLYFTNAFSITQRSIVLGSISSIKNETDSYFPLLFQTIIRPVLLQSNYDQYSTSYLSYNYSKSHLASAFRERSRPSKLETIIKGSLLRYPAMESGGDLLSRLDYLSHDLYVNAYANPKSLTDGGPEIFIQMEVLSLGPLFGRYSHWTNEHDSERKPASSEDNFTNYQLLNISLHFMFMKAPLEFSESPYKSISGLSLEGFYDTLVGEMYLIGCRKVIDGSFGTERGQDCLIEVKIEYTAQSLRWLINPTVKITITSQRNEDDPLHFSPLSVQTAMIRSEWHERDVIFRKTFEGIFRIVMVLVEIAIILSQFFYIKKTEDAIPFISIFMLAIQAKEFVFPLVAGGGILFKSKESKSYRTRPYDLDRYRLLLTTLDYTGKLLVLIVYFLMFSLFQKVSSSRVDRQRASMPSKPGDIPNDKQVFRITLAALTFAYTIMLRDKLSLYNVCLSLDLWFYLANEFFLLPQIIGNFLWKVQVKPLRKTYYIGFTLVRLLVHAFDYISDPVSDPYSGNIESEAVQSSYISNSGQIAVIVTMIMLAIIVHVQQRCSPQKLPSNKQTPTPHKELATLPIDIFTRLPLYARSICMSANCFINCHCHHYFT